MIAYLWSGGIKQSQFTSVLGFDDLEPGDLLILNVKATYGNVAL